MSYPNGRNVLSEGMKLKLAENGISFEILQNIYTRFGKNGLFPILALPVSSAKSTSKYRGRITGHRRIQAKILRYFEDHPLSELHSK